MQARRPHPADMTDEPLTPQNLRRSFGPGAMIARQAVAALHAALADVSPAALVRWRAFFGRWAGRAANKVPRHLARLAARYGVDSSPAGFERLLLALQTYYAVIVDLVADRLLGSHGDNLLPDSPFSWYSASAAVERLANRLRQTMASRPVVPWGPTAESGCDWFKPLYEDLFPRALRHQLGEYYTPDWLANHVLDQLGYSGQPAARLLDPACGSGTFLVLALRKWKQRRGEAGGPAAPTLLPSHFPVVGFDLNPLAVMTARANYLIAVADLLPRSGRVEVPVYLCDSILGSGAAGTCGAQFDYVVGNPPWVAWDNLPDADRQATKPLWERYGLFSLSGRDARHGGGKKDLSMLMLYAAADRYLKPAGRLGMVVTQTLFQTKGAGDGFRRFRLGPDGPPLRVLRVDDLTALRPFGNATNRTSTIVLEKGAATEYPVAYYRWTQQRRSSACAHWARPVDPARPNSPWLVLPDGDGRERAVRSGGADYVAHLGANTGGANGVYWVDVLGAAEGGVRVRSATARGKHRIGAIEQVIESDLLYPLLRWSDVRRWAAVPRGHILLAQDPATRTGIEDAVMRDRYPRALAYLEQFRELLVARAAYRRYQQRGPFYSMYNVGPYTVAPVKLVWRRMDRQINAAVVESHDDPLLGRRPVIPQETCVLVECNSTDEAHYLCAVLNSAAVNELVRASSVRGGKGFGTPGMLEFVPLRRFQVDNPHHRELAQLSRQAHAAAASRLANIERQLDRLAGEVLR
jgi:SAM-dependent methyltransferase